MKQGCCAEKRRRRRQQRRRQRRQSLVQHGLGRSWHDGAHDDGVGDHERDGASFPRRIRCAGGRFAVVESGIGSERDVGGFVVDVGGNDVVDGGVGVGVDAGVGVVVGVVGAAAGVEVEFGKAPGLGRVWPPSWSLLRKVRHYCDGGT